MNRFKKYEEKIILFIILIVAFALRYYKLTYQSLWGDELHTMIESDPGTSWKQFFDYLKCCDVQPPLHYILEKILFQVFDYSEFMARFPSVIAGTMSVWAIFALGKEMYNNRLGYIAAILTTVNFSGIYFSQEARSYIFVFLFTILSFLYLIRFVKDSGRANALYYALSSLLMLYSHYFGLFVLISQIVIAFIFFIHEQEKIKFLKLYSLSGVIIFIGFAPWIPFVFAASDIESFWIPPITPVFAMEFFFQYFGYADLLKPFLLLFFVLYISLAFTSIEKNKTEIKNSPLVSSFIFFSIWISLVYFIPYLVSIFFMPVLLGRYTIVILPAFLLMFAFGIELIKSSYVKYFILTIFCLLSLTNLFIEKKYYSTPSKTQLRELTLFINANKEPVYPIINERAHWHQAYYFKQFGLDLPFLPGKKEDIIDSIINRTGTYDIEGFWLIGAMGEPKLKEEDEKKLLASFVKVKEKDFFDAWAQLYVSMDSKNDKMKQINYTNFDSASVYQLEDPKVIALWSNGPVVSKPIQLSKGKYKMTLISKGTSVGNIFAHLNISVNDEKAGDYFTTGSYNTKQELYFELKEDKNSTIKIKMDNDSIDVVKNEDRNAFVRSIVLRKEE